MSKPLSPQLLQVLCFNILDLLLKVGTHEVTSPCNKMQGQVPLCELGNFASKSSHKDQL